jgi:ParB family chromosome partitioning protein
MTSNANKDRLNNTIRPVSPTSLGLSVNDTKSVLSIKSIPERGAPVAPASPPTSIDAAPEFVPGAPKSQISRVAIGDIRILGERRACRPEDVRTLADSVTEIGLMTPITVRLVELPRPDTGALEQAIVLVLGRHRLETARLLGRTDIDAVFVDCDETDARLREISENLHRVDLTVLEHAEHVAEWTRLTEARTKVLQIATPAGGQQPAEKGVRKAARDLGLDASTVSRSVKIDDIAPEAKKAAKDVGLDKNQTALLAIAKEATPTAQVAMVREIAARKARPRMSRPRPAGGGETMVSAEIECLKVEAVDTTDRLPKVDEELGDVRLAPTHAPSGEVTAAGPAQHDADDSIPAIFERGPLSREHEELFAILTTAWANSPAVVRERFIREVLRDKGTVER